MIGRQADTQASVGALCDLPNQDARREHAAIARADHTVAGAHKFGAFDEFDGGQFGIVARKDCALA